MEIGYRPAYAFEEILAAFGDATGAAGAKDTMLAQVEGMAQLITGNYSLQMPEILEADRTIVKAKYAFGVAPVDGGKTDETFETQLLRNVLEKEQLWRKSGYFWRLLLTRRELDLLTDDDRKSFGRNMAYYLVQSERMHRLLAWKDAVATGSLLLAAGVAIALYFFKLVPEKAYAIELAQARLFAAFWFVVVWMALLVIAVVWMNRIKPHGLRLGQLFQLVFLGPLLPDLRDYWKDDPYFKRFAE
jgi:hypothetical protein